MKLKKIVLTWKYTLVAVIICSYKSTLREHGLKGLYRGLVPNLFKIVPVVAISHIGFELLIGNYSKTAVQHS